MEKHTMTRRQFVSTASAGTLTAVTCGTIPAYGNLTKKAAKLAINLISQNN